MHPAEKERNKEKKKNNFVNKLALNKNPPPARLLYFEFIIPLGKGVVYTRATYICMYVYIKAPAGEQKDQRNIRGSAASIIPEERIESRYFGVNTLGARAPPLRARMLVEYTYEHGTRPGRKSSRWVVPLAATPGARLSATYTADSIDLGASGGRARALGARLRG